MKESDVAILSEDKKFTTGWWSSFLKKTHNLKKTTVFENCLTKEETLLMRSCLMDIVSQLSEMRTSQFGYRVFLEGSPLGFKDMQDIYDKAPSVDETFESWAKRSFGKKKFGMIINRGEKFSPQLAEMVSEKITPILE